MQWSPKQDAALKAIARWFKDPHSQQVFRLFGYAGTGKTTLAKQINEDIGGGALFGCFTGKAALVLQKKGCDGAGTLHSLCYKPQENEDTGEVTFVLNHDGPLSGVRLLIVDEVSMVGPDLGGDVLSFGTKVLVLGDPFQLPPINGEGFFTGCAPDILLDEIHRQAQDNPIIRMSMDIREGRGLAVGQYGDSWVCRRTDVPRDELAQHALGADQVLVGLNKTRNTLNRRIRELKGYTDKLPMVGERLMCLKNNKLVGLLNGSQWIAKDVSGHPERIKLVIDSIDGLGDGLKVDTHLEFFGGDPKNNMDWRVRKRFEEFDWAWAATCHKAQGSQWDDVLIFDESMVFRETSDQWLYTAVTRAAERVKVLM
jgi:exodeoxyribonuclease-5